MASLPRFSGKLQTDSGASLPGIGGKFDPDYAGRLNYLSNGSNRLGEILKIQ